jgi:glycosyltransferase involved in cell wall biosynthesis
MATLSILIPVYNESNTISRVIEAARNAPLPPGIDREILVVDDGSDRETRANLQAVSARIPFRLLRLPMNRGKGSAIRFGIPHATGDWILIQDGDMEYDPSGYDTIARSLLAGDAPVVYGSRFRGSIRAMGWQYRIANRMLTAWTNLLYGAAITDEATAYKAFRTDLLRSLPLRCRRFEFCPEVTGKILRAGIKIHEVPVDYLGRSKAMGKKIRWYDAVIAFWVLFRERFDRRTDRRPSPAQTAGS